MHRRYGRGAARLPLGTPLEAESLSHLALTPAVGERIGSLAPGLGCLALALLVGSLASSVTAPTAPLDAPTMIVADAWDVPPDPIVAPPPPPTAIVRNEPAPTAVPEPPAVSVPTPEASPEPFDPRALVASRAVPIPETAAAPAPSRTTVSRPGGLPTARDLALAVPRSPRAGAVPVAATATRSSVPDVARPIASGPATTTSETPAWDAIEERRAFLAALEAEPASPPAFAERALPAVATPTSAAARAVREAALDQLHAEGWEAVPLEDLPDCQPAGRQDALKRRILLAAAERPTCTHAEGAYRFLETRNLNAFLMGFRTVDTPTRTTSGPRNACEVLERALRCLEGTPSKEIESR